MRQGIMNVQQYFEERERAEQEQAKKEQVTQEVGKTESTVIPVVQEQAHIYKEEVASAKVHVHTNVTEVEKNLEVPLVSESYEVKRVPMDQLIDEHPPIREEGGHLIIPVVQEVLVVQKRLKLVEEVHLIKQQTTVTRTESFTLKKEEVTVERIPVNKGAGGNA
jgi:uncharacterized protein (TIGR02271 family)